MAYESPQLTTHNSRPTTHDPQLTAGSIANVFSTYESRLKPQGPVIARGINSIQLFHDGARWWIASATWQDESPGHPIPKEYLP